MFLFCRDRRDDPAPPSTRAQSNSAQINRPGHVRLDSSPAFSASVSASRNSRSAWNQNSSSLPDGRPFSSQISRARRRIRFLVGLAKMPARHCSFSESAEMRSTVSQSPIQRVKLRYFFAFARTLLTSCLRFMQTNEARLRIVHSRGQGEGGMTDEWQVKPPLIALSQFRWRPLSRKVHSFPCAVCTLRQCLAVSISASVAPLLRAHASAEAAVYLAT